MKKQGGFIEVYGARAHNLKNIDVQIPRESLIVITGLSGSGKSSLAFDTIYAEGQRRYIETFSAYARQFLGNLERPDVDKIEGLSPVIAIEQKTTSKSPRSTVGTITEIYDFLRLLYARASDAFSYNTGERMIRYTDHQIQELIYHEFKGESTIILAPIVRARKGHYRELFESIAKQGFLKVRIDGVITDLKKGMKVDRYKTHDIEIVIDRLKISGETNQNKRLKAAIETAMYYGEGILMVLLSFKDKSTKSKPRFFSRSLMCPTTGISYATPEPNSFSFNSPKGMCPHCKGLGSFYKVNTEKVIPNSNLSINKGAILPYEKQGNSWIKKQLELIANHFQADLNTPFNALPEGMQNAILYGLQTSFEMTSKTLGITRQLKIDFDGIIPFIESTYNNKDSRQLRRWAKSYMDKKICSACNGSRLRKESQFFKIDDKNIAELSQMDISELIKWVKKVPESLSTSQNTIAYEVLKEIESRLKFLLDVGLSYLSLNRNAKSLSGGESQRIRLATQIGSQLVGVLYILDEPSIGLHQKDNEKLIKSLERLRDLGNSVLVVEHDKDMILKADELIDIGPGAGKHGGIIQWQGAPKNLNKAQTLTANYLNGKKQIKIPKERRPGNGKILSLIGATGNNIKDLDLHLPLGCMIGITGVSGSGKSTLINETLYPILNKHFFNGVKKPKPFKQIKGLEHLDKVIDINQSPIGRTPRSNPATYTGVYSEIRNLFAKVPEAQIRGYKAGRFSFNVKAGRCEMCQGSGLKVIEMNFLPNVYVACDACQGHRYNRETLEIRYKGKSIFDVLEMTIEEACVFFEHIPKIYRTLKTIENVGLGYITLGQQSTTLSGGEAQRIKLASELAKRDTGKTIYILDEPTTGLHFEDIRVLLKVLNSLVNKGNTVVIIEHNLDVIKTVDYLVDLGPEGGNNGGQIMGVGTPEEFIANTKSHTAHFLGLELNPKN